VYASRTERIRKNKTRSYLNGWTETANLRKRITLFLRKLPNSYGILTDERYSLTYFWNGTREIRVRTNGNVTLETRRYEWRAWHDGRAWSDVCVDIRDENTAWGFRALRAQHKSVGRKFGAWQLLPAWRCCHPTTAHAQRTTAGHVTPLSLILIIIILLSLKYRTASHSNFWFSFMF